MEKTYKAYYNSPIGLIEVMGNDEGISYVDFADHTASYKEDEYIHPLIKECIRQLDLYFKGKLIEFDIKLNIEGTDFQKKVWMELLKIPYGKTSSYKDIAQALGNQKAVRAVGGANHRNKISIIIPCHRVIGSDGRLIGYGGGISRKEWLINHEREVLKKQK